MSLATQTAIDLMSNPLIAYVGPETMIPLGTVFAVAAGVMLTFGRTMIELLKTGLNFFRRK
jgi:hypothetical protein